MIEASHLSKVYSRGVYALRDLSLTVDKGEFIFLTGASGAGKSTFLRLILREDLASDGSLSVAGRDVLQVRRTPEDRERPVLVGELDRETEARVVAVCPGYRANTARSTRGSGLHLTA